MINRIKIVPINDTHSLPKPQQRNKQEQSDRRKTFSLFLVPLIDRSEIHLKTPT